jgi:hypothetical protein
MKNDITWENLIKDFIEFINDSKTKQQDESSKNQRDDDWNFFTPIDC